MRIRHYRPDGTIDEFWTDLDPEAAKNIVCQWVRDHRAERVELLDAEGDVVFRYPLETGDA